MERYPVFFSLKLCSPLHATADRVVRPIEIVLGSIVRDREPDLCAMIDNVVRNDAVAAYPLDAEKLHDSRFIADDVPPDCTRVAVSNTQPVVDPVVFDNGSVTPAPDFDAQSGSS